MQIGPTAKWSRFEIIAVRACQGWNQIEERPGRSIESHNAMLLHERSPKHKGNLWKSCERLPNDPAASERSEANVSRRGYAGFAAFSGRPNGRTITRTFDRTIGGAA